MPIHHLRVTNLGPFDDIAFEFDEHINVFVGPSSSGKSTSLMALANIEEVSTIDQFPVTDEA